MDTARLRLFVDALAALTAWALFGTSALAAPARTATEVVLGSPPATSDDGLLSAGDHKYGSATNLSQLQLPWLETGLPTRAGACGAGATGSTGVGGLCSSVGIVIRPLVLSLQTASRLVLVYLTGSRTQVPYGIFHPPRFALHRSDFAVGKLWMR